MTEFANNLQFELQEQLNFIQLETDMPLMRAELSINTIKKALDKLKQQVARHKFSNEFEEIIFFKTIKPRFFSKLIYFVQVYNIEMHKPSGSDKAKRKYFQKELSSIEDFFQKNLEFIKYYRTQKTYLDNKYFIRGRLDLSLNLDDFFFEADNKFSTSYDYKISKIIANELLELYIKGEIEALNNKPNHKSKSSELPKVRLTWTYSKAALVELIYALQTLGAFNNAQSSVKEIANYFEQIFNTDLSHFYTTFQEIKERKGSQTAFLKSLQSALQKRIDEQDENP